MKAKELRLAIVFFGGVSLAIYQHGINREILNLVRASKLHQASARRREGASSSMHARYPDEPERSTGDVYLRFLESMEPQLSLRVIIDVISGASAGALNGIALARALAHDLSLAPLSDTWLAQADVLSLLAPEARARPWSKWVLRPFLVQPLLARLAREGLIVGRVDAQMQQRISVFLRSRWFKPPLDGQRLAGLILDGLNAMEPPQPSSESLLPPGSSLDLLVTVTDFRGLERSIFIHDPPMVNEREHRGLLRFHLDHDRAGRLRSEFDADHVPSLAFAARASASFPGAFPAARLADMDALLEQRQQPWPTRSQFIARNFSGYRDQGRDPSEAVLLDGSILNNKPLLATLDAIRTHSAFREVDRRLVYIDPHSLTERASAEPGVPSYFATLRGALSDLPRTDPTFNDLADVSRRNRQVRRLKESIQHARPEVERLVVQSTQGGVFRDYSLADLRHWRLTSTNLLATMPLVYDGYMRSLVLEAVDFLADLVATACRLPRDSSARHFVQEVMETWARAQGVLLAHSYRMPDALYDNTDMPASSRWIIDFGVVYKKRRLNFVLYELNELYALAGPDNACAVDPEDLDLVKMRMYQLLDDLSKYDDIGFLSPQAVHLCQALFAAAPPGPVEAFVDREGTRLARLAARIAFECDLARSNGDADAVLCSAPVRKLAPRCRSAILSAYLGYFYWDVMIRPAVSALGLDAGPIEEILIDRIGPDDARTLAMPGPERALQGGALGGFGGFLSRAARENDYLWGRLHAVDRLFDILSSAVPGEWRQGQDLRAAKKAAFECVLEEEAARLVEIPELLQALRAAVAALETQAAVPETAGS